MSILRLQIHRRTCVAVVVFVPLFALLFQYRILGLLNKLGAHVTPIGTKFPIVLDFQRAPRLLLPFYHTLDYINSIWFSTLLGLFIGGAVIAFLQGFVRRRLNGNGLSQHIAGVLFGLPNMFCTCCAVNIIPGLRRTGAGLGPTLACFVTAPALNIVVIILAFELLPVKLALARLLLGVLAAVGATYFVAMLYPERPREVTPPEIQADESIGSMLRGWLGHTWGIARTVVPALLVGFLIIGLFKTLFPPETIARHFGGGFLSTVLASAVGTVLMVPSFTEVLWVGEMTKHGMEPGPAVALLITLPAVSFPSLWVLGRVVKSRKVAVSLGIFVLILGVIGGVISSMI
ncbi:MAG: permease [Armatimonadota bacterium]|nr:permease [Armatimonadota bacterium]